MPMSTPLAVRDWSVFAFDVLTFHSFCCARVSIGHESWPMVTRVQQKRETPGRQKANMLSSRFASGVLSGSEV
jgi:hypothetical protein